ncbi:hypothetical protein CRC_00715 [Cylindrospermopsis raciborskii CS-505]|nr:hypothetical protein CRC_00715 [Cylindrospermopsis raciborskii CS-505]
MNQKNQAPTNDPENADPENAGWLIFQQSM